MARNLFLKVKFLLIILLLPFGVAFTTNTYGFSIAEGNVFDCIEEKQNCEEDGVSTTEQRSESEGVSQARTHTVWDYVKMLFALAFVIGLLMILMRFINRNNRLYEKNRLMRNMGGISLGQQKSIQLVVVGDSYYIVGVGEDIRLLKEITDPDEIEKLKAFYEETDFVTTPGWLGRVIGSIMKSKDEGESPAPDKNPDFSSFFSEKLDELKKDRQKRIRELTEKRRERDE